MHLVQFGFEISTAMHANYDNEHSLTVLRCVSAFMDFYMCLGVSPFPKNQAKLACRNTCIFYCALADEATASGINAWKVKPKLHIFQECGEFQTEELGDPQGFWAYADEDYVGFAAEVGESRVGGGNASTATDRIVARVRALSA